ncbi:MAG: serine hydrolase [Pseudomonadota bacterium]
MLGASALLSSPAKIGAAYKAKTVCSEVFVANRDPATVASEDFNELSPALGFIRHKIDVEKKVVRASLLGLGASKAIYREGVGCALAVGGPPATVDFSAAGWAPQSTEFNVSGGDDALDRILDQAMADESANHRAFVIIANGEIIAERYASGFSKDTPFLSWSMAKSVTATLIGAAADRGFLALSDPAPIPEWADDARNVITWRDLLRMESGLEFEEVYDSTASDVNKMLFRSREMAAVAANKPAGRKPGEVFSYSSGTSNLLARALDGVLRNNGTNLQNFAREAIFGPIGAASFILETDASGNFIGSSYAYATARDWARLGQVYVQDGKWLDAQVLSSDWVSFVREPTAASDRYYGGHFWLNYDGLSGRERWLKGLLEDVYTMSGHEGQYVFIFPSDNIVIVRTGMTRGKPAVEAVSPVVKALYDVVASQGML